jgi:hypothetical protein
MGNMHGLIEPVMDEIISRGRAKKLLDATILKRSHQDQVYFMLSFLPPFYIIWGKPKDSRS